MYKCLVHVENIKCKKLLYINYGNTYYLFLHQIYPFPKLRDKDFSEIPSPLMFRVVLPNL